MGKKEKKHRECCERFKEKRKEPCKDCPRMAELSKKERKKLLARYD